MKIEELTKMYIGEESNELFGVATPERTERGTYLVENLKEGRFTEISSLNIQTSKYHQELLMDHIAIVVHKMYEMVKLENEETKKIAIAIALLHDIGKKYTIKINAVGDICYYNHEQLSADLSKVFLRSRGNFTEDEINMIYIVIHQHLQLKLIKDYIARRCYVEGFKKIYGEKAYEYIEMLNVCDQGIPEGIPIDYDYIKKGYSIIDDYSWF